MEKLLKAAQVADRLGTGVSTVYALAHAGVLPAVVIRQGLHKSCLRFRPESVDYFIRSRERAGETEPPQDGEGTG